MSSPHRALASLTAASAVLAVLLWQPPACAGRTPLRGPPVVLDAPSAINGRVIVTDEAGGVRVMRFERGGARQTAIRRGHPEQLELAYTRGVIAAALSAVRPQRVLVIGLGGGAIPMFLRHHYPAVSVDVVDIDPVVVQAATGLFDFKVDEHTRAHVADGRRFVERARGRWDLIVLDAYGRGAIPRHLATRQFLAAVRDHLTPDGVAVANVWERQYNPLYGRMRATYQAVFGELAVLGTGAGSHIFLASARPRGWTRDAMLAKARAAAAAQHFSFDLPRIIASGWGQAGGAPGAAVLVD
jgi:spermidine synthase